MDTKTKPTLLVATAMFLLLLSLQVSVSLGADTISANQSLSGGNLSERSAEAVLLDNGNLVLNDGSNPPTLPLWQSFDHPCNTFLPDGRIGYTGINKSNKIVLTSWKNSEDPAPGDYSLEQFLIGSEVYVSKANESYFTYDVYNSSIISRFMIDVLGQLKELILLQSDGWSMFWSQPKNPCQVYALCGAYGSCIENRWCPCRCLTGFEPKSPSDWNLTEYSSGCRRKVGKIS
nr:G-type lectin S-receptor-like serine/threonine-protein kinase At2g19130 [Ziziphus jujuba var. spinosa]